MNNATTGQPGRLYMHPHAYEDWIARPEPAPSADWTRRPWAVICTTCLLSARSTSEHAVEGQAVFHRLQAPDHKVDVAKMPFRVEGLDGWELLDVAWSNGWDVTYNSMPVGRVDVGAWYRWTCVDGCDDPDPVPHVEPSPAGRAFGALLAHRHRIHGSLLDLAGGPS